MSESQETITTGVKFKLYFDDEKDEDEMNRYFDQYANIVTFAARKINQLRNEWEKLSIKKIGDKWVSEEIGECGICKENTELFMKNKKSGLKVCSKCYNSEYGKQMIRKKLVPKLHGSNKRKVLPELNIRNAGKSLIQYIILLQEMLLNYCHLWINKKGKENNF